MSKSVVELTGILKPEEYAGIDEFSKKHNTENSLEKIAEYLHEKFEVDINTDPDIVKGYATDSSNLPGNAVGICRPANEKQCAALFRACFAAGIAITISGGKSNLTGSATPESGIVLTTEKMLEPKVSVDKNAMVATCPVGILLEDFRNEVLQLSNKELEFPVDPTSRAEASIGGALACNASGFTPGESGSFRGWVDSVKFIFPNGYLAKIKRGEYISEGGAFTLKSPDGEIAWPVPDYPRPETKNAGGPFSSSDGIIDLLDLIIGSEGIFGLAVSCTVKLAKKPENILDIFFSLPSETEALQFLAATMEKFNNNLSHLKAFEYFGVNCRKYMKHEEKLFNGDDQVGIYISEPIEGKDELEAAEEWLELLMSAGIDIDEESIMLLDNSKLQEMFMEARHSMPANALEVVQHQGTFTIMTDAVVPHEKFSEFLSATHSRLNEKKLDYLSFGHLGDCHLHFTILPKKEQIEEGVAAYDFVISESARLGGIYSGEHGTGKRKRKDFVKCYGESAVETIKKCKAAIDPNFLFNRGNVIEV